MANDKIETVLEGTKYFLGEYGWFNSETMIMPSDSTIAQLNAQVEPLLIKQDEALKAREEILKTADLAKMQMLFRRAWILLSRVWLHSGKKDLNVLSKMTALLRDAKKPEKALEISEPYAKLNNHALNTSRAAAYCDLEQWEKAKKELGKALKIAGSEESFLVVKRIKVARPDLYPK